MDFEDYEYQCFIGEYFVLCFEEVGVDGFLFDGFDLFDYGEEDDVFCDKDCVVGGVVLLVGLCKEFFDLVFVMQGGLLWLVCGVYVGWIYVVVMVDGVVGEEVYMLIYNFVKEVDLFVWKVVGVKVLGGIFVVFIQDYVNFCKDCVWVEFIYCVSCLYGFFFVIGIFFISCSCICCWIGF